MHNWLYESGANKEEPNGVYEITGGILWEMEIISEDNFIIEEKRDSRKVLEEIFAKMKLSKTKKIGNHNNCHEIYI